METLRGDAGIMVRLFKGEELIAALASLMRQRGLGSGFVTGLGAVEDVELGYYDIAKRTYERRHFEASHELVGLTGSLSWYDGSPFPHVHVVLGDSSMRAFAGHCFRARVSATVELLVRPQLRRVERAMDDEVGLHLMQLPERCEIRE